LNKLENALEDSKISIELDDKNIKAYLIFGQILAIMSKKYFNLEYI
jgi:hypothetical protein